MAENGNPNVEAAGKVTPDVPVATPEIKERSDKRMAMLSKSFINDAQRQQSTSGKPESEIQKQTPQSSVPKPPVTQTGAVQLEVAGKPKVDGQEPPKKPEEVKPPTEKKEVKPPEEKPAVQKKLTIDDVEKERKAQQSRADKLDADYRKLQEESKAWQTERVALLEKAELVDKFNSNPVQFINERLPELGKQLAGAGDPIKMIENEVDKYHSELLTQFKKQLGEDWEPTPTELTKPGTPSFRFQLAINAKIDEVRQRSSEYITSQRRREEEIVRQNNLDKEALITEYGFTEEDFKEANEILKKEGITYKNLIKLALMDKIIQQKISALPPVIEASHDVAHTRGASSEQITAEEKPKLSKQGQMMASRLAFSRTL